MAQPGKRPEASPYPRIKTPLTRLTRAKQRYNSAPPRILRRPRRHGESVPRLRSIVIIWGRIGALQIPDPVRQAFAHAVEIGTAFTGQFEHTAIIVRELGFIGGH